MVKSIMAIFSSYPKLPEGIFGILWITHFQTDWLQIGSELRPLSRRRRKPTPSWVRCRYDCCIRSTNALDDVQSSEVWETKNQPSHEYSALKFSNLLWTIEQSHFMSRQIFGYVTEIQKSMSFTWPHSTLEIPRGCFSHQVEHSDRQVLDKRAAAAAAKLVTAPWDRWVSVVMVSQ